MKKKTITFLICVIILVCLIAAVNMRGKADGSEPVETKANETIGRYTVLDKSGVTKINIEANGGSLSLINNDGWIIEGFESLPLNDSNVLTLVRCFENLSAEQKITSDDLAAYGLDQPKVKAAARYEDGSSVALSVGNLTPDGEYYYVSGEAAPHDIYLLDRLYGNRFFYTLNDMVDKTMPTISAYEIIYLNIAQKDRDEILIVYDEESGINMVASAGIQALEMKKPVDSITVYPNNLQTYVLKNLSGLKLSKLIEASCGELSKYGLSEPFLEIELKDMNNEVHLLFGDYTDDGSNIYCMRSSEHDVFVMDKTAVEPFIDVDIYKFVERFVALKYKDTLDGVSIFGSGADYSITISEEANLINGKEVDNAVFNPFYELLIGISFDMIKNDIPESYFNEPILTVVYSHKDEALQDTVCEYYAYNDNFYVVSKDGVGIYIVNRQSVDNMLSSLKRLE